MWRSVKATAPKGKVLLRGKVQNCLYATVAPKSSGGKKAIFGIVAVTTVGTGLTIAYAKFDPKFRKTIEGVVPFSSSLFGLFADSGSLDKKPKQPELTSQPIRKVGKPEPTVRSPLQDKKENHSDKQAAPSGQLESKSDINQHNNVKNKSTSDKQDSPVVDQDIFSSAPDFSTIENPLSVKKAYSVKPDDETSSDIDVFENSFKQLVEKTERAFKDAVLTQEAATDAIKTYTSKLYQALDTPDETMSNKLWKEADVANAAEIRAVKLANKKASESRELLKKLKYQIKKRFEAGDSQSAILMHGVEITDKIERRLELADLELHTAEVQSQAAIDYKNLVLKYREQFQNELQIVLPKYILKSQPISEEELRLLLEHAHKCIERLQKELAKQQLSYEVTVEKKRLELAYASEIEFLKNEFEMEMRQQLSRQAAAHADHLNEALTTQQQEMRRKHNQDLEDRLLYQRGVFISEISRSMSRLKEIEDFLSARVQLDDTTKKAQAIWFACQTLKTALKSGNFGKPNPLGKHVAFVQAAAGEDNTFVTTVIAGIPLKAVQRGVYTDEYLKERFINVKRTCRRVAMVDDNNKSLYRYFVSYLQSLLVVDKAIIPKAELEGKVAVDPIEWDTFDILGRVSYCLKSNDMEQALRYASQLRGEPKNVAKEWISEVRLLLETVQAIHCLVAYAAAVGVQAYH